MTHQSISQPISTETSIHSSLRTFAEPDVHVLRQDALERAVETARDNLMSLQHADGHWCGELEGDTILESEYVLLLHFLGRIDSDRATKACNRLRREQLPEGGWAIHPGGPPEASASVKAYFALKLIGDDPSAPHMQRARRAIVSLGGVDAVNTYTKLYLAIFEQYEWERCPAIPPEMMLLPSWSYFNLLEMSSWSRTIFVPLSIIWASRPSCPVPEHATIGELFAGDGAPRSNSAPGELRDRVVRSIFYGADALIRRVERSGFTPLRSRALKAAESWITQRLVASDGLGAIFPAIVMAVIALRCRGYPVDHPLVQSQLDALRRLELDGAETLQVQPCLSPVWDTAQCASALFETGVARDDPRLTRATRWLLDREVTHAGDWRSRKTRHFGGSPSGWYFEYANEFYPDCDDTAEVLTVLTKIGTADAELAGRIGGARRRGLAWLLSMQNPDGGWGAFDRRCDREALTLIPFADHNAMIDPSWEDITGRVLETLSGLDYDRHHPVVQRAVEFLKAKQCEDGTWYGRWGCNYIYGTWLALRGLACVGEDMAAPRYQRAADWLRAHQNADGGWGESPRSYEDPAHKGVGTSTAAQTSWALIGLFSCGDHSSRSVRRGIDYLLRTQEPDGSWHDEAWTGTGFPKVFYLRYDLYDDYFPLLALSLYRQQLTPEQGATEPGGEAEELSPAAMAHSAASLPGDPGHLHVSRS